MSEPDKSVSLKYTFIRFYCMDCGPLFGTEEDIREHFETTEHRLARRDSLRSAIRAAKERLASLRRSMAELRNETKPCGARRGWRE